MTAENPFRLEAEKVDFSLRYHHLEWLSMYSINFVETYGIPWELGDALNLTTKTTEEFNHVATDSMLSSANSLPVSLFRPFKRAYYQDIYGKSLDESDLVTQKRGEYFSELIKQIVENPDGYLKLASSPDGICSACVVGKHCKTSYPAIIKPLGDSDFITKHSLIFLSRRKFKGVRIYDKNIIVENGDVLLSNKTLFDKKFYLDLTKEIRKRFLTAVDFEYWNSLF